jgi:hypothetical protein
MEPALWLRVSREESEGKGEYQRQVASLEEKGSPGVNPWPRQQQQKGLASARDRDDILVRNAGKQRKLMRRR